MVPSPKQDEDEDDYRFFVRLFVRAKNSGLFLHLAYLPSTPTTHLSPDRATINSPISSEQNTF